MKLTVYALIAIALTLMVWQQRQMPDAPTVAHAQAIHDSFQSCFIERCTEMIDDYPGKEALVAGILLGEVDYLILQLKQIQAASNRYTRSLLNQMLQNLIVQQRYLRSGLYQGKHYEAMNTHLLGLLNQVIL